ncbi:hypothetical protein GOBAR_DD18562 [Gossypium barbadense]|nr:hypothetical protein GOBAR_DD18562 [Gossypium barbadense]
MASLLLIPLLLLLLLLITPRLAPLTALKGEEEATASKWHSAVVAPEGVGKRTNRVAWDVRILELGLGLGVEFEEGVSVSGRIRLRGRLEMRFHTRKVSELNR